MTLEDMLEALENMIVGLPSRKIPGAQDKKIVALHEIGHALLRVVDGEGNPVSRDKAVRPFEKVTCVPRRGIRVGICDQPARRGQAFKDKGRPAGRGALACLADGPRRS